MGQAFRRTCRNGHVHFFPCFDLPTTFRSTCGLCSVVMCTVAYGSFTAVLIIVAMLLCFQDALFSGKAEFNCLSVSLTAHFLHPVSGIQLLQLLSVRREVASRRQLLCLWMT